MKYSLIIAFAATLVLVSCNSMKKTTAQTNSSSTSAKSLTGVWELDHVPNPTGGTFEQLYMTRKPSITFDEKTGTYNGYSGCNTLSGKMELKKSAISFKGEMMMTKMACQGDGEKIFINNLKKINHYSISKDGQQLTFIQGDMALMHFHRMAQ